MDALIIFALVSFSLIVVVLIVALFRIKRRAITINCVKWYRTRSRIGR